MDQVIFPGPDALTSYRHILSNNARLPDVERGVQNALLKNAGNRWINDYLDQWISNTLSSSDIPATNLEWFWFNHFNVFYHKGIIGLALPDYFGHAIRPYCQGHFRDLLLAVITHPAMLIYLDNTNNVAGKLNENLARELLELHTVGIGGGYSQADVVTVARVLTGFGLRPLNEIRWPRDKIDLVREHGDFLFDPRRHDFSDKTFLGRRILGKGFTELEWLMDNLTAHPATAQHISGKLCVFFWGDHPPGTMLQDVAETFLKTGGDLRKTASVALEFSIRNNAVGDSSFKTPMQWVFSALRSLGGGARLLRPQPVRRWLEQLGQPLFGRSSPDGYSLHGADWLSSGQLAQRFLIAREMVQRMAMMWGDVQAKQAFSEVHMQKMLNNFTAKSRATIRDASSPQEKLILLLSSPDFMFRHPGEVSL